MPADKGGCNHSACQGTGRTRNDGKHRLDMSIAPVATKAGIAWAGGRVGKSARPLTERVHRSRFHEMLRTMVR
eukprot:scaffold21168_cov35-Tisochrysis_lutea.AAC.4